MAATLQIVTINDVYEIDNLPSFATCIKECKADPKAHKTISTLPGDFVAPSILSSLDKGSSMIECLNMCELDYASIGNHESDIPLKQLHCRMRESKFTWINSNMPDLPLPEILPTPPASASVSATTTSTTTDTSVLLPIILPEYVVVEVVGDDGHTRRVALIGLCGEDRSVMKPGAFNDCFIEPVLDSGAKWYKHLMNVEKVDTVIPLTHQLIAYDRIMAQQKVGYPVIIGGHDHQPFNEEYDNCKILKVGMDGQRFGIINITWPNAQWPSDKPIVTIIEKEANTIARDPIVSETVTKCKKILLELEQSNLCRIPKDMILSSIGMRLKPTTIGTFICTTLKKALNCEICMCGSGSIRASKNYVGRSYFTYADLKAEMPFSTLIVVLNLPGQVCADMISHTRAYALQSPPVAKGGYIQTDDGVVWDRESNKVLQINGMPLQVDRIYRVCINLQMLQGLDDVIPLIEWKASLPINDTNANQHEDTAVDAKQCIVSYFSQSLMWDILHSASGKLNNLLLKEIDTDHNGVISKAELKEYLLSATEGITDTYTDSDETNKIATTNMLVNNLFASIDIDSDGFISIREIFDMSSQHIEDIIFSSIHIKDVLSVEECIELFKKEMKTENLDTNMSACIKDEMVLLATSEFNARLIQAANMIDIDGDGYITREEYAIYLEQHFEEKRDIFKKMNI